jgi:hypothetical protein
MSFKIVNKNTKTTFCIVIQIFKILGFNLEYDSLKNSNLESRKRDPHSIPYNHPPYPPHLHPTHTHPGGPGALGFF